MGLCHGFEDLGSSFTFVWCPGHVGIQGSEVADVTTRNAADNPLIDVIPIRPDDAKLAATNTISNVWQPADAEQGEQNFCREAERPQTASRR